MAMLNNQRVYLSTKRSSYPLDPTPRVDQHGSTHRRPDRPRHHWSPGAEEAAFGHTKQPPASASRNVTRDSVVLTELCIKVWAHNWTIVTISKYQYQIYTYTIYIYYIVIQLYTYHQNVKTNVVRSSIADAAWGIPYSKHPQLHGPNVVISYVHHGLWRVFNTFDISRGRDWQSVKCL